MPVTRHMNLKPTTPAPVQQPGPTRQPRTEMPTARTEIQRGSLEGRISPAAK